MDGQYEGIAVSTWVAIIVCFMGYAALILASKIILRESPPQSVQYNPGVDLMALRHFPNMVMCPPPGLMNGAIIRLEGMHCGWRSDQLGGRNLCQWEAVPYLALDKAPILMPHGTNG